MFLLGHSMGGAVASLFVLEKEVGLQGLVLSAPALEPTENVSPVLILLSRVISRFFPAGAGYEGGYKGSLTLTGGYRGRPARPALQ